MLDTNGWATRTVDLPSTVDLTSASKPYAGVREDARTLLQELELIDGSVVVVAHSYGGIPVSEAIASAANVSHVVYLAAYQLDVGGSLLGHHGSPTPEYPHGFQPQAGWHTIPAT